MRRPADGVSAGESFAVTDAQPSSAEPLPPTVLGRLIERQALAGCRAEDESVDRLGGIVLNQTPQRLLVELAIAWVVNHPAVTSAIVGPRTMEQLDGQLPAADVTLDAAVLDRIDEIVAPGVTINPADTSYGEQVLQPMLRRR